MTSGKSSEGELSEELLTTRDVARYLRVSERHVSNLSKRGEFALPIRLGRSVRYRSQDVRRWFDIGGANSVA